MFEKKKLFKAIIAGDLELVKAIMAKKKYMYNEQLRGGSWTRPLTLAIRYGHRDIIDYLHENGASVTYEGSYANMLFDAVRFNRLDLLKDWAPQYSALMQERTWDQFTLLHMAAMYGHVEIVEWLLENQHADSEAQEKHGRTALYYAEQGKHEKVIALLKPLQERALKQYRDKASRLAPAQSPKTAWSKLEGLRIARVRDDADIGYRITEIFNFKTRERTCLYRNLETGAETAETRSFAEIGEGIIPDLRVAVGAFKVLGGQLPDSAVKDIMPALAPPIQQPRLIEKKTPDV